MRQEHHMQPPQASQYLNQAETLCKISAELRATDSTAAATPLEIAFECVMKAEGLFTAHDSDRTTG